MQYYSDLQSQIRNLSADYDKDEEELIREIEELDRENKKSLREYREVHKQAHATKDALLKVVGELNGDGKE